MSVLSEQEIKYDLIHRYVDWIEISDTAIEGVVRVEFGYTTPTGYSGTIFFNALLDGELVANNIDGDARDYLLRVLTPGDSHIIDILAQTSEDEEYSIDYSAQGNKVLLEWTASPDSDVQHYLIFQGVGATAEIDVDADDETDRVDA